MRIYSADTWSGITGEVFYDINLPQIQREFWLAPRVVEEAAFVPTSTANAGFFRQLTKYDISAIKKRFTIILTTAQSTTLQAMDASEQTEWIVDTGTAKYSCMIVFGFAFTEGQPAATLTISVLEAA
jgi:hypothetical protein